MSRNNSVKPPSKISIVALPTLNVRFYDGQQYPIQTGEKKRVRFASNTPILQLAPTEKEASPGDVDVSTEIRPTSLGDSLVEAATPGYRPVVHKITVTGKAILALCLIGGLLGGWLGYLNSKGSLWLRLVGGVVVALVASWAYVYIGLPKVNPIILHNQLSV